MTAMLIIFLSVGTIEFYADPVIYKTSIELQDTIAQTTMTQDFFYIEFNCEIPYAELHYESAENIIFTNVLMPFKITDLSRPDSLIDTVYRQFTIPTFSYAAKQQISFLVQFGTYLSEGRYEYSLEILSGDKQGLHEGMIEVEPKDYTMSDIMLSSEIAVDTLGEQLRKGDLRVIPRPSHIFDQRFKNLFFYYELYDVASKHDTVLLTYEIVDEDGKVVRKVTRTAEKTFPAQGMNCGMDIQGMENGGYVLSVRVEDNESNLLAKKETPFSIARRRRQIVSYEGMPYYRNIEYFLSSKQYKEFTNMPEQGQRMFLERFWQTHDYMSFAARFEYADEHYKFGDTPGYKTDRGRIYVKYGEPDEIERPLALQQQEQRPYEYWQYLNGVEFIFVDTRGVNDYLLVWTNAAGERSQPTLYKYLPSDKVQSLGINR